MANKYGFLEVLEEVLDRHFHYDYELNWDKRHHAITLNFVIEVPNQVGIVTVDVDGTESQEDILFEESVLFYSPEKTKFHADDYLVCLPYLAKKGYSREFLTYFIDFLNETVDQGLDDLMDFLANPEVEEFSMNWDEVAFNQGKSDLCETVFFPYPRY